MAAWIFVRCAKGDQMGIGKLRMIMAALVAMFAIGAVTSASASAEPAAGWMINGTNIASSAALATTAKTDKPGVIEGGGLNIECKGQLEGVNPEIKQTNKGFASSLVFTECKTANANCTVPTTVGTVGILIEVTLDPFNSLAVSGVFRPHVGTTFSTVKFSGEKCAVAGVKAITGDVEVLAPEGRDERTDQLLEVNQAATGLLKIASSAATLTGAALLLVASRQAWSFL